MLCELIEEYSDLMAEQPPAFAMLVSHTRHYELTLGA